MSLAMGATMGLAIILMGAGMVWPPALLCGVATLLSLPPVGIIGAMVGMASSRQWRYFLLGALLLALMGLAVFAGFLKLAA